MCGTATGLHEGFDSHCGLIVCDVEGGGVSFVMKDIVDLFKSSENIAVGGGDNWDSKYVVGVICIGDEEEMLAIEGSVW